MSDVLRKSSFTGGGCQVRWWLRRRSHGTLSATPSSCGCCTPISVAGTVCCSSRESANVFEVCASSEIEWEQGHRSDFHMERSRAIFEWVFALPLHQQSPPSPPSAGQGWSQVSTGGGMSSADGHASSCALPHVAYSFAFLAISDLVCPPRYPIISP